MTQQVLQALGGTSDITPGESERWQWLESVAQRVFHAYGFQEIRMPIIEPAEVFLRGLGDATEIVTKQMYLFEDRGERKVALRPEGTASTVRAFLERGLDRSGSGTRWYYNGPMFRAERPQAGRKRQFHQMGVELFKSPSPYADAEVILLLMELLKAFGLSRLQLKLNNLGNPDDRQRMVDAVREKMQGYSDELCEECQERLQTNPLRILDCKEDQCAGVTHRDEVDLKACLGEESTTHFETVLAALHQAGIKQGSGYELDPTLVRGLDYYNKTAFEVHHPDLGAQSALGGGGRYDGLMEVMGGQPTPAVGFAIGVERVLLALEAEKKLEAIDEEALKAPKAYLVVLGDSVVLPAFGFLKSLRDNGIPVLSDFGGKAMKKQMDRANKLGAQWVLILGESEQESGSVAIKDMATGEQEIVKQEESIAWLQQRL